MSSQPEKFDPDKEFAKFKKVFTKEFKKCPPEHVPELQRRVLAYLDKWKRDEEEKSLTE